MSTFIKGKEAVIKAIQLLNQPPESVISSKEFINSLSKLNSVVHVAAGDHSYADFSSIMAVRQAGWAVLSSSTVQEAHDMALMAHCVADQIKTPVVHFFDARRISEEYATVELVSPSIVESLQSYNKKDEPIKEEEEEEEKEKEKDIFTIIQEIMILFTTLTGRHYSPLVYTGSNEAEHVLVGLGAGATVMERTIRSKKDKVGVLKVHLYRPFPTDHWLKIMPLSTKRITVLEPCHDVTWNPLFLDVVALYQTAEIEIESGQYGDAHDFCPAQVRHILTQPIQTSPFHVSPQDTMESTRYADCEFLVAGDGGGDDDGQHWSIQYGKKMVDDGGKNVQVYQTDNLSHVRVSATQGPLIPTLISSAQALILTDPGLNVSAAVARLEKDGVIVVLTSNIEGLHTATKRAIGLKNIRVVHLKEEEGLASLLDTTTDLIQSLSTQTTPLTIPSDWDQIQVADTDTMTTSSSSKKTPHPLEAPYITMLEQLFQDRLEIFNGIKDHSVWSPNDQNPSPEYGYGRFLSQRQQCDRFIDKLESMLDTHPTISKWLMAAKAKHPNPNVITKEADTLLSSEPTDTYLLENKRLLYPTSAWLIGSDHWGQDLGQSGVHHVIAQGENINMLLVDTGDRKKDIGLYAMHFGNVYVASVAVYASYTGVLQALREADAYPGPSVVLAYLPHGDPVYTLKQTKIDVDSGQWPLYRWNPSLEEPFQLDSITIKTDLEQFLKRENQLSLIVRQVPQLCLEDGLESSIKKRHEALKKKSRQDYAKLLSGLTQSNGPPLTVLFGSDNGNAESVAKRIATGATARGLRVQWMAMDDYPDPESLSEETNLVFVCSTAGQGEFPSNARDLWKALNGMVDIGQVQYAVFGMGDSHYWPRADDAVFYNKPGKSLDAKLETLGANRLLPLGLGDDQDDDGYETALGQWLPELWASLGVKAAGHEEEAKFTDDQMKLDSNYLRGTIVQDLADASTGAVGEINGKLLKFHGTYGQDDRDLREERKKMGLEKAFSFMIRVRMPGGVATSSQWLEMDRLADTYANGAIKLTTRQAFQLHGVLKKNLRTTIREINHALLSTLAACGDVNRNIMITPVTDVPEIQPQVQQLGEALMKHLAPTTSAYHEIWLADEQVAGHALDHEPIYGPTYLPRKFKIVIAVPPSNDVDIYAHDLGYIAIVEGKKVVGYNVTIGGGMGMTHGNKKTYPRPANVVGYIPADLAVKCSEAVITTQRDYGDRTNRKHARFKYTIDTHGLPFIKKEIETRMGVSFEEAKPFQFHDNADRYGWNKGVDDKWHFVMFIENGKVKDWPDFQPKSGLKALAQWHKGDFRLSPNQHLVIANVPQVDLEKTKALLKKYKMDNLAFSGLRLNAMACVALPTCGLAMAESERYLPTMVTLLENAIEAAGLRDDAITIRMTGCPNGCARPYLGEIAFVGKAPNTYNVYLGGGHNGDRLNKLYKESLKEEEILNELNPIIKRYATERHENEPFGDFVIRTGYVKKTITGTDFHEL